MKPVLLLAVAGCASAPTLEFPASVMRIGHATAEVLACLEAAHEEPGLHEAMLSGGEACTPRAIRAAMTAARAWCDEGVLDGPVCLASNAVPPSFE